MIRYRFVTKAKDYRPLADMANIQMPWWCSGFFANGDAIIVCYLPKDEPLEKYWDDAYNIESEPRESIVYTSRFPKPEWIK